MNYKGTVVVDFLLVFSILETGWRGKFVQKTVVVELGWGAVLVGCELLSLLRRGLMNFSLHCLVLQYLLPNGATNPWGPVAVMVAICLWMAQPPILIGVYASSF
jgi:hypothetical protein